MVTLCFNQAGSLEDSYVVTSSEDKVRGSRNPLLSDARIQTSRKVCTASVYAYLTVQLDKL